MKVVLIGGPMDGREFTFAHGDTIAFPAEPPQLDFSVQTVNPIRMNTHLYRRSLRSPNVFVYQP